MTIIKRFLSDQIYDELKMQIINQDIPFGSKIVNRTLQERFNVSSSPIRDAINRLFSVNEILMGITNTGIQLSMQKSDIKEVVKTLKKYVALQKDNMGTVEYFKYDYEFHKTFIDFSNNSRLKKLYKQYNVLHEILLRCYYEKEIVDMQKGSIKTHEDMIKAFSENDIDKCIKLNEYHYKRAENLFKEMFKKTTKDS